MSKGELSPLPIRHVIAQVQKRCPPPTSFLPVLEKLEELALESSGEEAVLNPNQLLLLETL